jgi:hypothetical protein
MEAQALNRLTDERRSHHPPAVYATLIAIPVIALMLSFSLTKRVTVALLPRCRRRSDAEPLPVLACRNLRRFAGRANIAGARRFAQSLSAVAARPCSIAAHRNFVGLASRRNICRTRDRRPLCGVLGPGVHIGKSSPYAGGAERKRQQAKRKCQPHRIALLIEHVKPSA